jgi:hypothetical protein
MSKKTFSNSASKARKESTIKFLRSEKFRNGLIIAVSGFFLYQSVSFALQAREEGICKSDSEKIFKEITSEWEDTSRRASRTSRIALTPVVGEMQAIKRKLEKAEVPKCANFAKFLTTKAMNSEINLFLEFMENRSGGNYIQNEIDKKIAGKEITEILEKGKSSHNLDSESEMENKYFELQANELIEHSKKLREEIERGRNSNE